MSPQTADLEDTGRPRYKSTNSFYVLPTPGNRCILKLKYNKMDMILM